MSIAWARTRTGRWIAWTVATPVLLILLLAAFPWGLLAAHASGPLSRALGRTVTIGSARRIDWFSFVPRIELHDVHIAQPQWVGSGEMAHLDTIRLSVPVAALLLGRVRPRAIDVDGLSLNLVRSAGGRENWSGGKSASGAGGARLYNLTVDDGHLHLIDAKRHIVMQATLLSDGLHGLKIEGSGTHRGAPLTLAVSGPAIGNADPARPYPMHLVVRSPLALLDARLLLDHPLDTAHFSGHMDASGRDLSYLDDIIQAGLFHTQPFRLSAAVRHDDQAWRMDRLDAKVGRSVLAAALVVRKIDGRTRLDGSVAALTLDFDDFASDEQHVGAAAETRRIGPRVVPDTRIVLDTLRNLDGHLSVKASTLLSSGRSPFRSLVGIVVLDHQLLTFAPVTVGLPVGHMSGTASVDGRGKSPRLNVDLTVEAATIDTFLPDQQAVAGPFRARIRLAGNGPTVRDAVSRANGKVVLIVSHGTMRRDYATFMGGDVFKSVDAAVGGGAPRLGLDCLIGDFAAADGRLTPHPLLLSTSVARGDGEGSVILGSERIDLRIIGRPTRPGLLLSTAPDRLFGTLSDARIDIRPPRAKDPKTSGLLSRVGFLIKKLRVRGEADAKAAAPVDCPAAIRAALH